MSEFNFGGRKNLSTAKKTRRSRMTQERGDLKRKDAAERQAYCDSLSLRQRIENLDHKLGVGVGAVKERARLQARLEPDMTKKNSNKSIDPMIAQLTDSLTESLQVMVKDVTQSTKRFVEEELKKNKKIKGKSKDKRS